MSGFVGVFFVGFLVVVVGFFVCFVCFVLFFVFIFAVHAYSGIWLYSNAVNANLSTHRAQVQANQQIQGTRYSSISLAMEKGRKKGRWES